MAAWFAAVPALPWIVGFARAGWDKLTGKKPRPMPGTDGAGAVDFADLDRQAHLHLGALGVPELDPIVIAAGDVQQAASTFLAVKPDLSDAMLRLLLAQTALESSFGKGWGPGCWNMGAESCGTSQGGADFSCIEHEDKHKDGSSYVGRYKCFGSQQAAVTGYLRLLAADRYAKAWAAAEAGDAFEFVKQLFLGGWFEGTGETNEQRCGKYLAAILARLPAIDAALGAKGATDGNGLAEGARVAGIGPALAAGGLVLAAGAGGYALWRALRKEPGYQPPPPASAGARAGTPAPRPGTTSPTTKPGSTSPAPPAPAPSAKPRGGGKPKGGGGAKATADQGARTWTQAERDQELADWNAATRKAEAAAGVLSPEQDAALESPIGDALPVGFNPPPEDHNEGVAGGPPSEEAEDTRVAGFGGSVLAFGLGVLFAPGIRGALGAAYDGIRDGLELARITAQEEQTLYARDVIVQLPSGDLVEDGRLVSAFDPSKAGRTEDAGRAVAVAILGDPRVALLTARGWHFWATPSVSSSSARVAGAGISGGEPPAWSMPEPGEPPSAEPIQPQGTSRSIRGLMLAAVQQGRALNTDAFVEVEVPSLDLVITVPRRAFRARVQGYGAGPLLLGVSYNEQIAICNALGMISLTQEMVDAVWRAPFTERIEPVGHWAPGADISLLEFAVKHTESVDKAVASLNGGRGPGPDAVVRPEGKAWILDAHLPRSQGAVLWGWQRTDGTPLQGFGYRHNADHTDYSMCEPPALRWARYLSTGAPVDLLTWYRTVHFPQAAMQPFLDAYDTGAQPARSSDAA